VKNVNNSLNQSYLISSAGIITLVKAAFTS